VWRAATLEAQAIGQCTTIDPPCPPPPTLGVNVQSVGDTTTRATVTVYFDVTGLSGGTRSTSLTVNGSVQSSPSWTLTRNQTDATGSVLANLTPGANNIVITFCESGSCQSGSTQVYYVAPPPPPSRAAPIASFDRLAQYQRTVMDCDGCAYATLGYSTPSYRSLDEDRSLTLVYSSGQSAPIGLVSLDVNPNSTDLPSKISLSLIYNGSAVPLVSGGSEAFYSAGSGVNRVTAAFDASAYGSGPYNMTAIVRNWWADGAMLEAQLPVRVLILNERSSGFGSGWSMAGLQRISIPNGSAGDAAITDGGSITAFANCGLSCWTRPGSSETLAYVAANNTVERHYRDGTVAVFNASNGLLQQVTDRLGHSTSYLYDSHGRPTQITDPAGLATTITWTGAPGSASTASITTPGGRTTTLRTNSSGELIDITDPDGVRNLEVSYSANRITSATNRIGGTTSFTYDRFSALASVTGPAVQTDDRGLASSTVTFSSREMASLPAVGLGSTSAPASRVWPDSVWLRVTTQRGDITKVRANDVGDATLVLRIDALGKADSTVVSYDLNGRPVTVATTPGRRMTYTWDNELLSAVTDNASHVTTSYTYNTLGQRLTTKVNQGLVEQNYYSTAASRLDSTKAGSSVTRFTWDGYGRPLNVTDGEGHYTSFTYNSSGFRNVATVTNAGHTTQFAYDGYGRPSGVTDPLSHTSSVVYDAVNRPTSATAPNMTTSTWSYNDTTRRYSFTDAKSQSDTSVLNAAGAVIQSIDPRGLSDYYRYDSDGNPSSGTSRGGRSIAITRDTLGRPVQVTAGTLVTTISYDTARKWTAYSNAEGVDTVFVDGDGRVVNQVAVRNNVRYSLRASFDSAGRRQTLNAESPLWSGMKTLYFGYDVLDRQTAVYDFAGQGTKVTYNRDSRPDTVTLPTSSTPSARLRQVYSYGSNDRLSAVVGSQAQSVLNWAYGYDAVDRAISLAQGNSDYSVERTASYDNMGRLTQWTDTEHSPGEPYTVCEDPTQIYGDGCTTFYPIESNTLRSETYTYDAVGNRTDRGGTVQTGNRLTSFNGYTMTYDDDGNLLTKSGNGVSQSFTWNALGQLASVTTNGSTTTFGYDGLGRRVRKTTNGVATYFLYDGDNIVMQLSSTGQPQLEFSYYPGVDQPHAVRQSSTGAVYYYVTSQPGHVSALVNASGQVVNRYDYTPFGQAIATTEQIAQPFRYTARQLDSETGLYYYRARYYDPAIARFISEDPIGLAGGVNQYAYVGNDPINRLDPSGTCELWAKYKVTTYQRPDGQIVQTRKLIPGSFYWVNCDNSDGTTGSSRSSKTRSQKPPVCSVPLAPYGVDINENIGAAKWSPGLDLMFYFYVRNGGPWDYKQMGKRFEDFGNFNFGATGAAAGYATPVLLRGAGWAQVRAKTSNPAWGVPFSLKSPFGTGTFGDDPHDQEMIRNGINYYEAYSSGKCK